MEYGPYPLLREEKPLSRPSSLTLFIKKKKKKRCFSPLIGRKNKLKNLPSLLTAEWDLSLQTWATDCPELRSAPGGLWWWQLSGVTKEMCLLHTHAMVTATSPQKHGLMDEEKGSGTGLFISKFMINHQSPPHLLWAQPGWMRDGKQSDPTFWVGDGFLVHQLVLL